MTVSSRRGQLPGGVLFKPKGREVPEKTRLFLFVRAAGRCQFDGCNRYLLEHHLTNTDGNFAQMAHIWAFSRRGPRSRGEGKQTVHDISNLMLLCGNCHKLVDDHPDEYTTEVLRKHKLAHESRIFMLTGTHPDRHTVALVLVARIAGRTVSVSLPEMQQAVAPRYLGARDVITVDLTAIPDHPSGDYWKAAATAIRSKVQLMYEQDSEHGPIRHLSVFALGAIPLLVHLGTCLSDKVPLTLYQRHRDTDAWTWKEDGETVRYEFRTLQDGGCSTSVALLLSLSGRIRQDDLPPLIDASFTTYEITLASVEPTPRFLDLEASLQAFQEIFMSSVRHLVASHPGLRTIHLFPATPAPVAISVGRDLMPKRDPAVLVYDYDRRVGGFIPTLEVNNHESE